MTEKDDRSTGVGKFLSSLPKDHSSLGVLLLIFSAFLMTTVLQSGNSEVLGGAAFLAGLIAFTGIDLITARLPRNR